MSRESKGCVYMQKDEANKSNGKMGKETRKRYRGQNAPEGAAARATLNNSTYSNGEYTRLSTGRGRCR